MSIVLHAHTIHHVITISYVVIGIAHEGIELTLCRAVLVSQRDVELLVGIACTQCEAMSIFPVGIVGC